MARYLNPRLLAINATGANPPAHILTDEKFATLNGEQIYLFLLSQEELIWYAQWMEHTDEAAFNEAIVNALGELEAAGQREALWEPDVFYIPKSVTTDGWRAVQNAWQTLVPGVDLIECNLHGRKRVTATLSEFSNAHPEVSRQAHQQLKTDFDQIFAAPSVAAFSQRVRRLREQHIDEPILLKRLDILADKRSLFTNHLKFDNAPAFSSALDRSMRFLDEKLLSFGQFRATDSIDPMLNAWAIVNNLRAFLPDAKKAGQSLAQFFGAQLHGLPWMEALNLATVGALDKLLQAAKL